MSRDLVPRDPNQISLSNGNPKDLERIKREAAKQLAAEELRALKAARGNQLITELERQAILARHGLVDETWRSANASQDEEVRERLRRDTDTLLGDHLRHVRGINEVAAEGIAREVHKDVIPPDEPKKRFGLF